MTAAFRAYDAKERAQDKEKRAKERLQERLKGGRLSPTLFGGRLAPPLVGALSASIGRARPSSRGVQGTRGASLGATGRPRSPGALSKGFTPVFTVGQHLAASGARTLASRLPNMVSRPAGGFTGGVLPSPRIGPHPLQSPRGGTYIPIVGDAVFLNAVAHAVASAAGAPATTLEPLLDFNLGEAEAILVPLFGGPLVQHLKRPC